MSNSNLMPPIPSSSLSIHCQTFTFQLNDTVLQFVILWWQRCWWQLYDVGDGLGHFGHQDPLSFNISVVHQHSKDVPNIPISPASWWPYYLTHIYDLFFKKSAMEKIISLEGLNRLGIRILNKVTSNLSTAELEEKSPDSKRVKILENPGLFSRQVST